MRYEFFILKRLVQLLWQRPHLINKRLLGSVWWGTWIGFIDTRIREHLVSEERAQFEQLLATKDFDAAERVVTGVKHYLGEFDPVALGFSSQLRLKMFITNR